METITAAYHIEIQAVGERPQRIVESVRGHLDTVIFADTTLAINLLSKVECKEIEDLRHTGKLVGTRLEIINNPDTDRQEH